ncbi:hypothetical protein [Spiroplasma clarkii]|uniref:hypothetical protein n=1 Tax=Spiroplasma clarkii TaxID=2139 RepID=UPI001F2362AB|nr:hypothetical protein [Spiroplasma clarkii]
MDEELKVINEDIYKKNLQLPNIPNDNMPVGKDENDNVEIRKWVKKDFRKTNIPHWDIATRLNLVDFELGAKISGTRFLAYTENGAIMVRAIADILLKRHKKHGYKEMMLPLLVNEENMLGTGQLPKFEDDAYKIDNQFLIPTSEVSLTNIVRGEIVDTKNYQCI